MSDNSLVVVAKFVTHNTPFSIIAAFDRVYWHRNSLGVDS